MLRDEPNHDHLALVVVLIHCKKQLLLSSTAPEVEASAESEAETHCVVICKESPFSFSSVGSHDHWQAANISLLLSSAAESPDGTCEAISTAEKLLDGTKSFLVQTEEMKRNMQDYTFKLEMTGLQKRKET